MIPRPTGPAVRSHSNARRRERGQSSERGVCGGQSSARDASFMLLIDRSRMASSGSRGCLSHPPAQLAPAHALITMHDADGGCGDAPGLGQPAGRVHVHAPPRFRCRRRRCPIGRNATRHKRSLCLPRRRPPTARARAKMREQGARPPTRAPSPVPARHENSDLSTWPPLQCPATKMGTVDLLCSYKKIRRVDLGATARHGTARHVTSRHVTSRHVTAWHGTARHGRPGDGGSGIGPRCPRPLLSSWASGNGRREKLQVEQEEGEQEGEQAGARRIRQRPRRWRR